MEGIDSEFSEFFDSDRLEKLIRKIYGAPTFVGELEDHEIEELNNYFRQTKGIPFDRSDFNKEIYEKPDYLNVNVATYLHNEIRRREKDKDQRNEEIEPTKIEGETKRNSKTSIEYWQSLLIIELLIDEDILPKTWSSSKWKPLLSMIIGQKNFKDLYQNYDKGVLAKLKGNLTPNQKGVYKKNLIGIRELFTQLYLIDQDIKMKNIKDKIDTILLKFN